MISVLITLAVATGVGLLLRRRNGRFRRAVSSWPDAHQAVPGAAVTLLQISAERCAVCPQVAATLGDLAARTPGLAHREIRAEDDLDLVRRHDVLRSPTVLVLDGTGAVVARASGAVTADQAWQAVAPLLATSGTRDLGEAARAQR
ncbi:thioredoxin family protein [Isoptericola sp. b490]|uniref:thioredoxin family protein n=1 Tax=Actinotalea lenta TaxID=3064654 RepID=UPI002712ADC3|nr:thioredoxin family protein [Isoptericola sp. b490]MDO8120465.1 thioredoxin family protein [Isoptericola sp. b490]